MAPRRPCPPNPNGHQGQQARIQRNRVMDKAPTFVGMLTDRDIAVRAVAKGKGPDAKVRDAMTPDVKYCFEDEDLDDAVRSMGEQKVRRLPVMGRDKRLVGIVSLGDVAVYADSKQTDAAVSAVSEPGGPHTQAG